MTDKMTVSYQGNPCYDIVFSESFDGLSKEIPERMRGRKACIVTDSQVAPLYVSPVKAALEGVFGVCEVFSFPAGEGPFFSPFCRKFSRPLRLSVCMGSTKTGKVVNICTLCRYVNKNQK